MEKGSNVGILISTEQERNSSPLGIPRIQDQVKEETLQTAINHLSALVEKKQMISLSPLPCHNASNAEPASSHGPASG